MIVSSICSVPLGWTRHVQPAGQPYYVKTLDGRTYMTDTDVTKPDNMERMQGHIDDMEVRIKGILKDLPREFQIYLEPVQFHLKPVPVTLLYYYMINHDQDHRCVFWIDKFNVRDYYWKDEGLHSLSRWRT